MTYYVRAFRSDGVVPTIGVILAWAGEHGLDLDPPPAMPEFVSWVGEPPPDWEAEEVALLPRSPQRDQVLAHLARTASWSRSTCRSARWTTTRGFEAVAVVVDYLTEHHGALIHVEGEGFSQAGRVILETTW